MMDRIATFLYINFLTYFYRYEEKVNNKQSYMLHSSDWHVDEIDSRHGYWLNSAANLVPVLPGVPPSVASCTELSAITQHQSNFLHVN